MKQNLNTNLDNYLTSEFKRSMVVSDEHTNEIVRPSEDPEIITETVVKETALVKTETSKSQNNEVGETSIRPITRNYSLVETGEPDEIIRRKHEIAKVLQHIVNTRPKGFEVNGVRTLNYEEWLMIAKMHGCYPRTVSTTYGLEKYSEVCFEAVAEVVHIPTGNVIARAESMASKSEKGKEWFDLNKIRSLAQTRAGSKAMRMVFSDIAVLAGYSPTPLEEIEDMVQPQGAPAIKGMIVS